MIKINQRARNDNLPGMTESIKSFPAMAQLSSGRDHLKKKKQVDFCWQEIDNIFVKQPISNFFGENWR